MATAINVVRAVTMASAVNMVNVTNIAVAVNMVIAVNMVNVVNITIAVNMASDVSMASAVNMDLTVNMASALNMVNVVNIAIAVNMASAVSMAITVNMFSAVSKASAVNMDRDINMDIAVNMDRAVNVAKALPQSHFHSLLTDVTIILRSSGSLHSVGLSQAAWHCILSKACLVTEGQWRKRAPTFKNESNLSITFMNRNCITCLDINDYSSEINNSSKCIKNKQDVFSRNHICPGKATSITYHERVSVDLATMQHCACTVL
jgi:hypothetical protein